jgi:putative ABC transport system permease protein
MQLLFNMRYAVRALLKAPGFTGSAIVLLALGIGANTAIFTVVNAVLLRPLPFPDPDRLVRVWHVPPEKSFPGVKTFPVSPANFLDWRAESRTFESMSAYSTRHANLTVGDRPESVTATYADSSFFNVVGVKPALGRTYTPDEDRSGAGHVAVLSHRIWKTRFGSAKSILGKTITLDGNQHTVIGVMPASFGLRTWGATDADLWIPAAWDAKMRAERKNHNWSVVGRLRPGVNVNRALAEMGTISRRLEMRYPEADQGWGATVIPLREQLVQDLRPALLLLLGAVVFVLLIACANVANLVLARTLARRKELAIRLALGASRARTLRHVLSETLVLSFAGGIAGLGIAHFGVKLILACLSDQLPPGTEAGMDATVLGFTLAVSTLTGLLAGLWPSWKTTRVDLNDSLKLGAGRGESESTRQFTRSALVVAEVALSLVLLIGATLTIRSLWNLYGVSAGFDAKNVLTMSVAIPKAAYPGSSNEISFYRSVLAKVRAVPAVENAAIIDSLPLTGGGSMQPFTVEGHAAVVFAEQPEVAVRRISAQYVDAMRIPLLQGRTFNDADVERGNPVVLISESMANGFWKGEDPIGKRVTLSFVPGVAREVVGVVGDVKDYGIDVLAPAPTLYEPHAQTGGGHMSLVVRTRVPPGALTRAIADAVHSVDRDLPLTDVKTMEDVIAESVSQQRFTMLLLGAFAGLALILAAIGIYSVLAYTVSKRLREISIRMAVGAKMGDVIRLVVLEAIKPAAIGVIVGLAVANAMSKVIASHVYGVEPTDPATFAAVSFLLIFVAMAASIIPAWRATRVDPIQALREN